MDNKNTADCLQYDAIIQIAETNIKTKPRQIVVLFGMFPRTIETSTIGG